MYFGNYLFTLAHFRKSCIWSKRRALVPPKGPSIKGAFLYNMGHIYVAQTLAVLKLLLITIKGYDSYLISLDYI